MRVALFVSVLVLALAGSAAGTQAAPPVAARIAVVDERGAQVADADVFALRNGVLVPLGQASKTGELAVSANPDELLVARSGSRSSAPAKLTGERLRIVLPIAKIGFVRARNDRADEKTVTSASESAVVFDDVALARSLVPNYHSRAEGGSGHQTLNGVPLDLPAGPRGSASDEPAFPVT
jgi:hypothetical protein